MSADSSSWWIPLKFPISINTTHITPKGNIDHSCLVLSQFHHSFLPCITSPKFQWCCYLHHHSHLPGNKVPVEHMCSWWCITMESHQNEHVKCWAQIEERTREKTRWKWLVVSRKVKDFVLLRERLEEKNRAVIFPHRMNAWLKSYDLIYVWLTLICVPRHFHRSWTSTVLTLVLCENLRGLGLCESN